MYSERAFLGVLCVYSGELVSGCNGPESQEVLVSREVCLHLVLGASLGPNAPFRLWLPSPACLRRGMGRSEAY